MPTEARKAKCNYKGVSFRYHNLVLIVDSLLFIWKKIALPMTGGLIMTSVLIPIFLRRATIPWKSSKGSLASFAGCSLSSRRPFHNTPSRSVVKPYLLADIGEGIHMISEFQILRTQTKILQELPNVESSIGLSSQEIVSTNLMPFARCNQTKHLLRYEPYMSALSLVKLTSEKDHVTV